MFWVYDPPTEQMAVSVCVSALILGSRATRRYNKRQRYEESESQQRRFAFYPARTWGKEAEVIQILLRSHVASRSHTGDATQTNLTCVEMY